MGSRVQHIDNRPRVTCFDKKLATKSTSLLVERKILNRKMVIEKQD